MKIVIRNTSSPGASFTDNTNEVLLKTYEWILAHQNLEISFRDFRSRLEQEMNINDNNNRNIYPLLKNAGMAEYEKGGTINVSSFFTNTGVGYVETLKLIKMINSGNYNDEQKSFAIKKSEEILQEIVYKGLLNIIGVNDTNYVQPLKDLICFLINYEKISKEEYAYFLYERSNNDSTSATLSNIKNNIEKYRKSEIIFEVEVEVRNDTEIREETNADNRKEGLSYLTSFTYFTGLLQQAGMTYKDGKYFVLSPNKKAYAKKLIGE